MATYSSNPTILEIKRSFYLEDSIGPIHVLENNELLLPCIEDGATMWKHEDSFTEGEAEEFKSWVKEQLEDFL